MMKIWPFLIVLISYSAQAQMYFLGQGGFAQLNQDAASENNVRPRGMSYGAGLGIRKDYLEVEGILQKMSLAGEIDHDGAKNSLIHEDTSFTVALNFYLSRSFYARLGYAFHRIDQSLETPVSDASMAGARTAYNIQEDAIIDGVTYGGGYVIYNGKKLDIFTQFESMNLSPAEASVWNFALGFRYHWN